MKNRIFKSPKLFQAFDAVCILAVLLVSVLLFFVSGSLFHTSEQTAYLKINADGHICSLPLDTDCSKVFYSNGIKLTVTVSDGYAWVAESECPDRVCRAMGRISRAGQTVVCVPAKFSMTVISQQTEGEVLPDAIVG